MKKIWAMRKDNEGVSPVIATILMVAITVVLAAVLYVMVINMTPQDTSQVIIGWDKDSTATNWTMNINRIDGVTKLDKVDCYVTVKKADGTIGMTQRLLSAMVSGTYYSGVRFIESGAAAPATDQMNSGDSFTFDRTIYGIGSKLQITSLDGTQSFANIDIAS